MKMKEPCHPGLLVRDVCLEALKVKVTVTEAAKALGVSRGALSRVLNGRAAVSPDMAIRLSMAFGSSPETWLRMQAAYDLAQAEKRAGRIKVRRFRLAPAHP